MRGAGEREGLAASGGQEFTLDAGASEWGDARAGEEEGGGDLRSAVVRGRETHAQLASGIPKNSALAETVAPGVCWYIVKKVDALYPYTKP